jgi:hypothetical protein
MKKEQTTTAQPSADIFETLLNQHVTLSETPLRCEDHAGLCTFENTGQQTLNRADFNASLVQWAMANVYVGGPPQNPNRRKRSYTQTNITNPILPDRAQEPRLPREEGQQHGSNPTEGWSSKFPINREADKASNPY